MVSSNMNYLKFVHTYPLIHVLSALLVPILIGIFTRSWWWALGVPLAFIYLFITTTKASSKYGRYDEDDDPIIDLYDDWY